DPAGSGRVNRPAGPENGREQAASGPGGPPEWHRLGRAGDGVRRPRRLGRGDRLLPPGDGPRPERRPLAVPARRSGEPERRRGRAHTPCARKKSAIAMAELSRRAGRAKDADGFDHAASLLPPDHFWENPFTAAVADLRRGRRALMNQYVAREAAHEDRATVQ